jgi:hypothetical protein
MDRHEDILTSISVAKHNNVFKSRLSEEGTKKGVDNTGISNCKHTLASKTLKIQHINKF